MNNLKGNREDQLVCLIGLILGLGTLACYWPARHFDFINLDDPEYVYSSPMVRQGLTWPGFLWAFQSIDAGNWNPLVWLSHMADCQLYGLNPGGHHMTNVLLHTANVLMLFLLLRSLTGAVWRSAFVAAIFAWHPMHVESVAWISERKDVLSAFFFFPAIWAYACFTKRADQRRILFYVLSLVFFALGLMSKSMLVTTPFVLLLLDYWPLRRVEPLGKLVLEKAPFLALSAASSLAAIWTQGKAGAMITTASLANRAGNAAISYVKYLEKFLWPTRMAIFYPYPNSISPWHVVGAVLLLGLISCIVFFGTGRRRYLGVGWLWFLGTLVPVIGLISVGMQSMADRYTYLPYIGISLAVGWGLAEVAELWPRLRSLVAALCVLALVGLFAGTSVQVNYWKDNMAVYHHALDVTSGNYIAMGNLGEALLDKGKTGEAEKILKEVIAIKPHASIAYAGLGQAYAIQGKIAEAMGMFSNALQLNPREKSARCNLGIALSRSGKPKEAIVELKIALQIDPDDRVTLRELANALAKTGRAADAVPYLESLIREDPHDAHAHFSLGWAYSVAKRYNDALVNYKEAVRLAPESPPCLNALAWLYATCPDATVRDEGEAVQLATRACQITKRENPEMLDTLGAAFANANRFDDALKTVEQVRLLGNASHDTNILKMAQERLELYKAGKPYRNDQ